MSEQDFTTEIIFKLAAARDLIDVLDELLVCYRIGKRPTGKLLDRIPMLRDKVGRRTNGDE